MTEKILHFIVIYNVRRKKNKKFVCTINYNWINSDYYNASLEYELYIKYKYNIV